MLFEVQGAKVVLLFYNRFSSTTYGHGNLRFVVVQGQPNSEGSVKRKKKGQDAYKNVEEGERKKISYRFEWLGQRCRCFSCPERTCAGRRRHRAPFLYFSPVMRVQHTQKMERLCISESN